MTSMTPSYYVPHLQTGHDSAGSGSAHSYTSRVRWGRLAIVAVSIGVLLFTGSQLMGGPDAAKTAEDSIAAAVGSGLGESATGPGDGAGSTGGADYTPPPSGDSMSPRTGSESTLGLSERRPAADREAARKKKAAAAAAAAKAKKRRAKAAAAAGGGTAAGDDLPFTGAPTWLAAVLGGALLGGGLLLQLRADTVAQTASGYRRGPGLRPMETLREWHRAWYQWRIDIAIRD